jgi:hypothetical protein
MIEAEQQFPYSDYRYQLTLSGNLTKQGPREYNKKKNNGWARFPEARPL